MSEVKEQLENLLKEFDIKKEKILNKATKEDLESLKIFSASSDTTLFRIGAIANQQLRELDYNE